jgi:hypothetical protein
MASMGASAVRWAVVRRISEVSVSAGLMVLAWGCGSSGSGSSQPSGPHVYCMDTFSATDPFCVDVIVHGSDTVASEMQSCTMNSRQIISSCPTANLVGCCQVPGLENCFYAQASTHQHNCEADGQTWSTTPF